MVLSWLQGKMLDCGQGPSKNARSEGLEFLEVVGGSDEAVLRLFGGER